jgi:uncharacterized protein YegL
MQATQQTEPTPSTEAVLIVPPLLATSSPVATDNRQANCASANILFLVDRSGSLSQEDMDSVATFIERFAANQPIAAGQVSMGIMTFNETPNVLQGITDDPAQFARGVQVLRRQTPGGSTDISAALQMGKLRLDEAARANAAQVLVLVSDGNQSIDAPSPSPAIVANSIRGEVAIFGIVTGENPGLMTFSQITSAFYEVSDISQLENALEPISEQTCDLLQTAPRISALQPTVTITTTTIAPSSTATLEGGVDGLPFDLPFSAWWLLLPLALLLFLFMWLLAGLFGRNNRGQQTPSDPVAKVPPPTPPLSFPVRLLTLNSGWQNRLNSKTPPTLNTAKEPYPFVTLVVGVGNSGLRVLNELVVSADNTLITDGIAHKTVAGRLRLLHIDFPQTEPGRPVAQAVAKRITYTKDRAYLDKELIHTEAIYLGTTNELGVVRPSEKNSNLAWVKTANKIGQGQGRQVPRIAFYRHFEQTGSDANIPRWLGKNLDDVEQIIIVASGASSEASIVADFAGLLYALRDNHSRKINRHVVLIESDSRNDGSDNSQVNFAATLLETARLREATRSNYRFGPGFSTPQQRDQIVQHVSYIPDSDARDSIERTTVFIWSLLTARGLTTQFDDEISQTDTNRRIPKVHRVQVLDYSFPLALLRELLVERLMVCCLEKTTDLPASSYPIDANLPTRIANPDPDTINQILNQTRPFGMLVQLETLETALLYSNEQVSRIKRDFIDRIDNAKKQQDKYRQALRNHNVQVNDAVITTPDEDDILLVLEGVGLVSALRPKATGDLVGWLQPTGNGVPELKVDPNGERYLQELERMIRIIAANKISGIHMRAFEQRVSSNKAYDERWRNEPIKANQLDLNVDTDKLTPVQFGVNAPSGWAQQNVSSSDPTHITQLLVVGNIPLSRLKQVTNAPGLATALIHQADSIVLDIYKDAQRLTQIPTRLHSALDHREAVWVLFLVYRQAGRDGLRQLFPTLLPNMETTIEWEEITWAFIEKYELNRPNDFTQAIDILLDAPAPAIFAHDSTDTSPFGKMLLEAFDYFETLHTSDSPESRLFPPSSYKENP